VVGHVGHRWSKQEHGPTACGDAGVVEPGEALTHPRSSHDGCERGNVAVLLGAHDVEHGKIPAIQCLASNVVLACFWSSAAAYLLVLDECDDMHGAAAGVV
jgi:hypothetical protein